MLTLLCSNMAHIGCFCGSAGSSYHNGGHFHENFTFRNPEDVFREFFRGTDPFAEFFGTFCSPRFEYVTCLEFSTFHFCVLLLVYYISYTCSPLNTFSV